MSDGGEGFVDALGGANRTLTVSGPLGDPVEAAWRFEHDRAVIEMAAAAGLTLVGGPDHNDPMAASTHGVGELIATRRRERGPTGADRRGRLGHDRRRPRCAAGPLPGGSLPRRRAAGRHRRPHDVRRCRRGVRPAEGRDARTGRTAPTPPRAAGRHVRRRLRRRRARPRGFGRRRRAGRWPGGHRCAIWAPGSTWWPTR